MDIVKPAFLLSLPQYLYGLLDQNLHGCDWLLEIDLFNVMVQGKLVCQMRIVDSLSGYKMPGYQAIKCFKGE